ncbi:TCP-1/cpn60 chaperonin family protein [Salinirubellus sp. GCM10025818]|uniref:TCP-1/cpn60 chaperonin family protein n=1 Tax=Salinirubellus TaxID=2162630 RepID=UPI0030D1BF19
MDIGRDEPGYEAVAPGEWSIVDADARQYVRGATREVASLVRTTYGPLGMEKQLRTKDRKNNPETVHTADAGEIMDGIQRAQGFSHPAAALFVDAVDSMQRGLRDGATTAILLTDALVERGLELVEEGVHPGTIVVGYAIAAGRAGEVLDGMARPVDPEDAALLGDVAATAMAGELEAPVRERYADLVVEAVGGLAATSGDWLDTDDVKVLAGPGEPSGLTRGLIVRRYKEELGAGEEAERAQNWSIRDKVDWGFDWSLMEPREDVTLALLDREIDFEASALSFGDDEDNMKSGVDIRSAEDLEAYRAGRDDRIGATADRLADLGVDILVSQPEVDAEITFAMEERDIVVVDEVEYPLSDVYRLARASGGEVVGNVDDLTADHLGTAGRVSERRVGDEKWTEFGDCPGGVFTLVVGSETATERERRERIVEDALEVTVRAAIDRQALPGAGAPAMAVASDLRSYAESVEGREGLAVEAFGDALADLVRVLAANSGADPLEAVTTLRAAHAATDGPAALGIGPDADEPIDAWEAGVVEPRRVFSQAVETARATTEQLITIDAVLHPGVDLERFVSEPNRE